MDTFRERKFCTEIDRCKDRFYDAITHYNSVKKFSCITENPGFIRNCLQWEVLENAWLAYKQMYGKAAYENGMKHKRYSL